MKPLKQIKSFVCRNSRLTNLQLQVKSQSWPLYGLEITANTILDFAKIFQNNNPCVLEIGFGNGSSLLEMARTHKNINFIGIEVFTAGIYNVCSVAHKENLHNLRVICHDALEVLEHNIGTHSLSKLQLFFPDPWHKKRHHKRRIVRHNLLNLVAPKLCQGGVVHFATDWEPYALEMLQILTKDNRFENVYAAYDNAANSYSESSVYQSFADNFKLNLRPATKFEQRGLKLGHKVFDLVYRIV